MSGLNTHQRLWLREQIQMRSALLRAEIRAALNRSEEGQAGLANHLLEVDDEAVASRQSELDIAELERDVHELQELQHALRRMCDDDYGVCEDCGADIPFARMRADPQAIRCVPCQTREERRRRRHAPQEM